MADVETPAAESSPAAIEETKPSTPPADEIGSMSVPKDPEDYAEWRQTGKLPSKKDEDSAPSKAKSVTPESEPGTKTRQAKNAETRKEELNREIRELLARRDEIKKDVKPAAEPSPAPPEPEKQASDRPKKPRQEDFKTWEEYETAQDKYLEDLTDWKSGKKIEEHDQRLRQESATQAMQVKLNEARSRYGEEAEPKILSTAKTVFDDQKVAPAIKAAITRSKVMVDALYVMGSDEAELSGFLELAKQDPLEALRKWFVVEGLVQTELAKTKPAEPDESPPRASNGRFQPAKRPTPPPPTELSGNSAPAGDESERAAATGNVRAFFEARNRRDFAKWKGQ